MAENRIAGFTEDVPEIITAQDVVKKRQYECLEAALAMDNKIADMEQALAAARREREMIRMEYEMWENYSDRNQFRVTHTSTTTVELHGHDNRMGTGDRMKFEDCLKGILREAGKPLRFADIRARLEKFGIVWNNYVTAHGYITTHGKGIMELAGKKGYYQPVPVK